jgi:hydrogenase maturation factor
MIPPDEFGARPLRPGKVPPRLLSRLLDRCPTRGDRVRLGPSYGEDAAVIDFGDRYLIAAADPVTFATEALGYYAVVVNANDVATRGAAPRWFLATVLLPQGATPELAESIFQDMGRACRELGIVLVGGHTEVVTGLPHAIVAGHMLGEATASELRTTADARAGDQLILTKSFPLEGAALLARDFRHLLPPDAYSAEELAQAGAFLFDPGICVAAEAAAVRRINAVHAMHDPTEGGLAEGIWELATAAGVGARVETGELPLLPLGRRLCEHLGLDPLGLIASGALLLAVEPTAAAAVLQALEESGAPGHVIGQLTHTPGAVVMVDERGGKQPLPRFPEDELARLMARA